MKSPINNIVHLIIPVLDLEKARSFYSQLFTWEFVKHHEYAIDFQIADDDFLSGSLQLQDTMPSSDGIWFFVYVDDLSHSCKLVEQYGGELVENPYGLDSYPGKMAVCRDPFGNRFGLWCDQG